MKSSVHLKRTHATRGRFIASLSASVPLMFLETEAPYYPLTVEALCRLYN